MHLYISSIVSYTPRTVANANTIKILVKTKRSHIIPPATDPTT